VAPFPVPLTECSRIPVDDPNTHLELTMIHEVMVLDHCGPDFAYIQYGAALKLWLLSALIVGLILPVTHTIWIDLTLSLACMFALAVLVGAVESVMARLRMVRVPQLLAGATTLAILALVLEFRAS
jgi:formate hydrogenlyase subunit 4